MKKLLLAAAFIALWCGGAGAQGMQRIPSCGNGAPTAGGSAGYMDANGNLCTTSAPGSRAIVPLDISTVTTGGTAVTALNAGHATAGGFVVSSNAAGICVNQIGTAGTSTAGGTVCVAQNQIYTLVPSANAVSVNSTASGAFGGEGLQ